MISGELRWPSPAPGASVPGRTLLPALSVSPQVHFWTPMATCLSSMLDEVPSAQGLTRCLAHRGALKPVERSCYKEQIAVPL
jgi:hypothetical protein